MIHRVATSELYRCPPTQIRRGWAFRDLIHAHIHLDLVAELRAEQEAPNAFPG